MTDDLTSHEVLRTPKRSERLRQRAAWMYFVEEMTQSAIADAQSAIDSDAPKSRLDELARELSEKLVALQQAAPPASEDGAQDGSKPQGQDDDVVDADFKPAS